MANTYRRPRVWAYVALGLAIGIAVGAGLLVWQRLALNEEIDALSGRLEAAETSATQSAQLITGYDARLASAEASLQALAEQNSQLASELVATKSALATATAALQEASRTITITERSVSPTSVEASKSLSLQVKLKGKADKVQMKIVGQSGIAYTKTFNLSKSATSAGIETWKRTITAPLAVGVYRYYAYAYVGSKVYEMPGVSAWSFQVVAP